MTMVLLLRVQNAEEVVDSDDPIHHGGVCHNTSGLVANCLGGR